MTTPEILAAFPRYSALIVGDICLDRRCIYDPGAAEPSRETRISRLGVVASEVSPGGGGTVGNNLASLGITRLAVLGAVGEDGFGWELTRSLNARGISTDLLVRSSEVPTFTYTKLINASTDEEDQPRVDFINSRPLPSSVEKQILLHLQNFADTFDVLFVSDQAETKQGGVVTPAVREGLLEIARANPKKIIWVDSRVRVERFQNMILKPNEQEADAASIGLFGDVDYQRLRNHAHSKLMFITRGSQGVLVVEENSEVAVPAPAVREPVDVCGAGDSFSAGAAMALAITGSAIEAARFGNLVASVTIMKKGTGTANPAEVLAAARGMSTLAIDIGGTKFSMAVFEGGRMVERASRATDREGGPEWMVGQIASIAKDWATGYQFKRCGIGFGGPVEFERQRVALSTHVGGWSDFDLPQRLEPLLGMRPVMDNDANVGALGEGLYGTGRGYRPLFYMTLSTGIGGGILTSGETIYRGADSYAGELGHIVIRPDGPECLCGWRGCFERMCGGLWLERDYGRPAEELLGDPAFVARYVVDLAMGLKAAIMLLNPARIVIGGGISKAGDALLIPLRSEVRRQITTWSRARIEVVAASLGDDSVLYGAMALAENR